VITYGSLSTRGVSTLDLPANHAGPSIRIFGRVSRQTYISVSRAPTYPQPELFLTVAEGSTTQIPVFPNPSLIFSENEHRLYTHVQRIENLQYLEEMTMLDGTNATDYGPVNLAGTPYDVCQRTTAKGFQVKAIPRFCKVSDGSIPRGRPSNWGETTIFYRFCDGCNCAPGPVSRRGGAFVKITFTCGPNLSPVGRDLTIRVLPGSTNAVNISALISDPDNTLGELYIRFSLLQPTYGTLVGADDSTLDNVNWLISSQNVKFIASNLSFTSDVFYAVSDPYYATSPNYRIRFIPYLPPDWSVTPSSLTLNRLSTDSFNFTITDVDSTSFTFDIAALQRQNVPLPSTLTFIGPDGQVNILTLDPTATIATIPNPVPGQAVNVRVAWTPGAFLPDGATGAFIATLVDSEGLSAPPLTLRVNVVPNQIPFSLGTTSDTEFYENNAFSPEGSVHPIVIRGDDDDFYHKDHLAIRFTQLPTLGDLSFNDNTSVVAATLYNTSSFRSNSVDASTAYTLTYSQDRNVDGNDFFCFVYVDDLGATSVEDCVNITILHVNNPPISNNFTIIVGTGNATSVTIQASDFETTDPITLFINDDITSISGWFNFGPTNVTDAASFPGPSSKSWTFDYYAPNFVGNYTFTFYVFDGTNNSVTYYGNIIVLQTIPPNAPPFAGDLDVSTPEEVPVLIDLTPVIGDADVGDYISTVTFLTLPDSALGRLVDFNGNDVNSNVVPLVNGSVLLTFIPNRDVNGTTLFTYTVSDSFGVASNVGAVTIDVLPVADPPTITITPLALLRDRLVSGSFSFTVTDVDSLSFTVAIVNASVATASNLTFSPASTRLADGDVVEDIYSGPQGTVANYISWVPLTTIVDNTRGTFQLMVTDDQGLTAFSQFVTLDVTPNKIPFGNFPTAPYSVDEDTSVPVQIRATDPDVYHQTTLSLALNSLPKFGRLVTVDGVTVTPSMIGTPIAIVNAVANGTAAAFTYFPSGQYNGNDTFTFTATDAFGATSDPYPVDFIVNPVDDPPVSGNVSLIVRQNACINPTCTFISVSINTTQIFSSDPENDPTSLVLVTLPAPAKGRLMYKDPLSDTWVPVADYRVDLTFLPSESWVFSFEPAINQHSSEFDPYDTFTFLVRTSTADSEVYTGTIYVIHVNQPPFGDNIDVTTDMNVPITITLPRDDIDTLVEDLKLVVVSVSADNKGVFSYPSGEVISAGEPRFGFDVVFSPSLNAYSNPTASPLGVLTFRVVDDEGLTSPIYTARVFVNFVPLNITYRNNTELTIDEDTSTSFFVDRYNVDWFGSNEGFDKVSVAVNNLVGNGSLAACAAGTSNCEPVSEGFVMPPGSSLRYTPAPNENGPRYFNFTITLTPNNGAPSITIPWTINVSPINDPPTLVPLFSVSKNVLNACDEDTYFVVRFQGDDIDSPKSALKSIFISFLDKNVANRLFLCDGTPSVNATVYDGDCYAGTPVTDGLEWSPAGLKRDLAFANFSMVFIPNPNLNGQTRFLVAVMDDYAARSTPVVVDLLIYPINDPPKFDELEAEFVYEAATNETYFRVFGTTSDIDFKFGKHVRLTVTVADLNATLGEPASASPCTWQDDGYTIVCEGLINSVNSWFASGFRVIPKEGVTDVNVSFILDDLGNVDKDLNPNITYASLSLNRTIEELLATKPVVADNTALIAAPIAGLLAGLVIMGLVWWFRANSTKDAVDAYFQRAALNLEGSANTSPLYKGAATGGESVLYQPQRVDDL